MPLLATPQNVDFQRTAPGVIGPPSRLALPDAEMEPGPGLELVFPITRLAPDLPPSRSPALPTPPVQSVTKYFILILN